MPTPAPPLLLLLASHLPLLLASFLPTPPGWSLSQNFSLDYMISPPYNYNAYYPDLDIQAVPVLQSSTSNSTGFSFGFLVTVHQNNTDVLLSICKSNNNISTGLFFYAPYNQVFWVPVWSLWSRDNYNNSMASPIQHQGVGNVSLEVDHQQRLLLRDGDGSVVWSVRNVAAMEMSDSGNLVFYDSNNQSVWQSFDHPTDTLLPNQTLRVGMKLVSNNSLYSAVMQPGGLQFFFNSTSVDGPAVPYWSLQLSPSLDLFDFRFLEAQAIDLQHNGLCSSPHANTTFDSTGVLTSSSVPGTACAMSLHFSQPDFVRLDKDGHLRGYVLVVSDKIVELLSAGDAFDAQISHDDFSGTTIATGFNLLRSCHVPNTCGAYGICSPQGSAVQRPCRCPSATENETLHGAFLPVDSSNFSLGCNRTVQLPCPTNASSPATSSTLLVEIKNASLISVPFFQSQNATTFPLHECQNRCNSDCSCTGFLYDSNTSLCLPVPQEAVGIIDISNVSFDDTRISNFTLYLKIALPKNPSSSRFLAAVVASTCSVAFFLACIATIGTWYFLCKRHVGDGESRRAEEELLNALQLQLTRYSYQEVRRITNGFSEMLGAGGFGSVYKGCLADGRNVAVKNLELVSRSQKQFLAEVATIGATSHLNVVHLHGFCSQRVDRLLIYEYMENGSLDQWLFRRRETHFLDWTKRFNVAVGTARGLFYLHEECPQPIFHLDVKPENILLDSEFLPKLADFGLSRLIDRGTSRVVTGVRGTPGYIAPEWLTHSIATKKCDVFSYGMVVLELVGGRRNLDPSLMEGGDECWYFPRWAALQCGEGKMMEEVIDKRLNGHFQEEEARRMIQVAFLCIQQDHNLRPSMATVVKLLEGDMEIEPAAFHLALEGQVRVARVSVGSL